MRAQKRDANEPAIIDGLVAIGCSVTQLEGGDGKPDLLVGYRSTNFLLEVKDPTAPTARRRLNSLQKKWHSAWKGRAHLVETFAQALAIVTKV